METLLQGIMFIAAFAYVPLVVIYIGPLYNGHADKAERRSLVALIILGGFGIYQLGIIFKVWQVAPY